MIRKYFTITCDYCGATENFNALTNSARSANNKVKEWGWIVGKYGKDHYCSQECKTKRQCYNDN